MKQSIGERCFQIANYIFLTAAALTMLLPLVHLLAVSLSSPIAADSKEVFLWPVDFTLASWKHIAQSSSLWQSFGITVFITVVGTLLSMLFSVLTAFPLSRREFLPVSR